MSKEKKGSPQKSASSRSAGKKSSVRKSAPNQAAAARAGAASGPAPALRAATRLARPSAVELHEEIRQRAYQLFCERGSQHGSHEADWQRAEREVRAKYE